MNLAVHGLRARIEGRADVVDAVRRDFAWFATGDGGAVDVTVTVADGSPGTAPGWPEASFVTPRNAVYHHGARTLVDYGGRAHSVHDAGPPETLTVTGTDRDLLHEAVYHFLLSRIGRHLDAVGLPRLHALGLAGRQGAVAVLLPSGGGKSTLATRALRAGAGLLSEDTPLIDRRGYLHPFPLRIGLDPADAAALPASAVRVVERMEFQPKALVDLEALGGRVEPAPQPLAHLVIGRRSLRDAPVLRPAPRRAAMGPLLREAVVGVGVYQGMEFLLQRGPADAGRLAPVALTRARSCAAGLRRARVWELVLSTDHDANWAALAPLLA